MTSRFLFPKFHVKVTLSLIQTVARVLQGLFEGCIMPYSKAAVRLLQSCFSPSLVEETMVKIMDGNM